MFEIQVTRNLIKWILIHDKHKSVPCGIVSTARDAF